jgi:hypothetical protein
MLNKLPNEYGLQEIPNLIRHLQLQMNVSQSNTEKSAIQNQILMLQIELSKKLTGG